MKIFIYSSTIMLVLLLYTMKMSGSFGIYHFVFPQLTLTSYTLQTLNYEDNLSFCILKKNPVLYYDYFSILFNLPPQSISLLSLIDFFMLSLFCYCIFTIPCLKQEKVIRVSTLAFPCWWMNS